MSWHATCLDDRKMDFPEDQLIENVLKSDLGQKFLQSCINIWTSILGKGHEVARMMLFKCDAV